MHSESSDPWSNQLLLRTVTAYGGVGADSDQPEPIRFLRGVAQVLRKRLKSGDETALAPAVFLLCPAEPEHVSSVDVVYHPMLDNGLTPVEGRLWLVGPVVVSGKSLPLETTDDNTMFEFVIDGLDRGDVPAIIYDPRVDLAQLRYYPAGLQNADHVEIIEVHVEVMDLKRILAVIDHACDAHLVTPDAQDQVAKLWEDPGRHLPIKNAELTIQMYLVTSFSAAFPTLIIRKEQPQTTGRLDIEIEEPDYTRPGRFVRHAILELKVLRSYRSTGNQVSSAEVQRWVSEGVDQAYSYREERGSLSSALCCFDMRKSHDDMSAFEQVAERAIRLNVTIRNWLLYASAKDRRRIISALFCV